MMTAHGTPEITGDALALGAYRVVAKPFELADVAALVHEAHDASKTFSAAGQRS
jgi:DNA-binding NtrC family response regulator